MIDLQFDWKMLRPERISTHGHELVCMCNNTCISYTVS